MVKNKETKITTSVKPTLLLKPEPEKKKMGRPKKVKPPHSTTPSGIDPDRCAELVYENDTKSSKLIAQEEQLKLQAITVRADYLEERNRFLQQELAKADNLTEELKNLKSQLGILHSKQNKMLSFLEVPKESGTYNVKFVDAADTVIKANLNRESAEGAFSGNLTTRKYPNIQKIPVWAEFAEREEAINKLQEEDKNFVTTKTFNTSIKYINVNICTINGKIDIVIVWNWILFVIVFIALIILFIKTF